MKEIFKRLFIVHKCAACQEILNYNSYSNALCDECARSIEVAKTESCAECSKAAFECSCQPKLLANGGSRCLRKLFFYHKDDRNEPQNKLIYFMKHHSSKRAPAFVARELWRGLEDELHSIGVSDPPTECVAINVPRGRKALIKYGFDQSAEVCRAFSELYGIPYVPALGRKRGGREQKRLNAAERKKNMKSIIYENEKLSSSICDKYVILFDDIVTTGASMSACLPVLRKMGIKGVICCAVAVDLKNKAPR